MPHFSLARPSGQGQRHGAAGCQGVAFTIQKICGHGQKDGQHQGPVQGGQKAKNLNFCNLKK